MVAESVSRRDGQPGCARRASRSDVGLTAEFGPRRPQFVPRRAIGNTKEGKRAGAGPAYLAGGWLRAGGVHGGGWRLMSKKRGCSWAMSEYAERTALMLKHIAIWQCADGRLEVNDQ
jgi:hypothetical protein